MMRHRGHCLLKVSTLALVAGMWPGTIAAQATRFVTVGGGAAFPGGASRGMNTGWLAEIMGGLTLPGNVVTMRLAGSYGQNRVDAQTSGMMGGVDGAGGIDRTLGAMGAVMVMPDLDRDLIPYALAGAGVMHSRFQRNTTSFAWATGVGARLQTDIADFYVESRFARVRKNGRYHDMIPLTAGIRFDNR